MYTKKTRHVWYMSGTGHMFTKKTRHIHYISGTGHMYTKKTTHLVICRVLVIQYVHKENQTYTV